ncbi:MAG: 6-carboxytetrahydropterin synthase [Polyangiales bacterium]
MFQVAIKKPLTAFHRLIGGDWGKENEHHSHDYVVEVIIEGAELDRHGYLFDIAELRTHLDRVHARYEQSNLNDLPEFAGQNPSVERFAQYFADQLRNGGLVLPGMTYMTIKLWEDADTWASFRTKLG